MLATPADPAIRAVMGAVAKNYGCQFAVNYYAEQLGEPDHIVEDKAAVVANRMVVRLGNRAAPDLCGTLTYEVPLGIEPRSRLSAPLLSFEGLQSVVGNMLASSADRAAAADRKREDEAFQEISAIVDAAFIKETSEVSIRVDNLIQRFLPHGRYLPAPSTENLQMTMKDFEASLADKFREFMKSKAWSAPEVDHFIERARCSPLLPRATPPDLTASARYELALKRLSGFRRVSGARPTAISRRVVTTTKNSRH